jgi:hypothetical protein
MRIINPMKQSSFKQGEESLFQNMTRRSPERKASRAKAKLDLLMDLKIGEQFNY